MKITPREKRRRVSPVLAWGDFHARSRVARSTIPEEKWGTTRSLKYGLLMLSNLLVPCSVKTKRLCNLIFYFLKSGDVNPFLQCLHNFCKKNVFATYMFRLLETLQVYLFSGSQYLGKLKAGFETTYQ